MMVRTHVIELVDDMPVYKEITVTPKKVKELIYALHKLTMHEQARLDRLDVDDGTGGCIEFQHAKELLTELGIWTWTWDTNDDR